MERRLAVESFLWSLRQACDLRWLADSPALAAAANDAGLDPSVPAPCSALPIPPLPLTAGRCLAVSTAVRPTQWLASTTTRSTAIWPPDSAVASGGSFGSESQSLPQVGARSPRSKYRLRSISMALITSGCARSRRRDILASLPPGWPDPQARGGARPGSGRSGQGAGAHTMDYPPTQWP